MECPKCGGEVYDNRRKVAEGWNGPTFKCKDQDGCGWVEFKKKGKGGGGGGSRGNGGGGNAAPKSTRPLGPVYFESMQVAYRSLRRTLPQDAPIDAMALHAATSTLFIQACSSGAPLRPKQAEEPPPEPAGEDDDEHLFDT